MQKDELDGPHSGMLRKKQVFQRAHAAPVAQLDRALPSEGRGREFESRRVRHFFNKLEKYFSF